MNKAEKPQIIILCEDKAHYHFMKGYCEAAGWKSRQLFPDLCPPGSQSAEQWVRQRFEQTLRSFRSMHGQGRNICLMIMIDADRFSPEERKSQLQQNIQRESNEPVGIFVPKRNIQSWMAWIDGNYTNEDTDHKNAYQKKSPNSLYGKKLRAICIKPNSKELPPSVQDACREWETRIFSIM